MDSEGFSVFGAFEGYQWGQAYIHPCDGNRGNSKGEPLWLWVIQQGQAASLLAHDFPQESLVCYTCRRGWRGKRGAVLYAPPLLRQENSLIFCTWEWANNRAGFRERRQVYASRPSSCATTCGQSVPRLRPHTVSHIRFCYFYFFPRCGFGFFSKSDFCTILFSHFFSSWDSFP